MSRTTLALVAALVAAPAAAQEKTQPKPPQLPDGAQAFRDLRYGPHQERNVLDLYVPKADGPVPLVVLVHGGGWSGGSKESNVGAVRRLLDRGYALAAINYRLSQHAVYPAQIHDCKAAVRFLRGSAKKYNLNPDAFGAWGSSAGGHLVALLGTTGDVKDLEGDVGDFKTTSSRVQCVVDFYGPTDLTKMGSMAGPNSKLDHDAPTSPESRLLGGPVQMRKELAAKANPVDYVTRDDPAFLILHGDADPLVPLGQSELLHDALKKAGVPSELVVIKGGGHGGAGFSTPENVAKLGQFFDSHLKRK
jgi:acetyl esterase/lipase